MVFGIQLHGYTPGSMSTRRYCCKAVLTTKREFKRELALSFLTLITGFLNTGIISYSGTLGIW